LVVAVENLRIFWSRLKLAKSLVLSLGNTSCNVMVVPCINLRKKQHPMENYQKNHATWGPANQKAPTPTSVRWMNIFNQS